MAFLEISGLKKRFGAAEVLKGIDLDLEEVGSWCWSAPRAAASPRCSTPSPGSNPLPRAKSGSTAATSSICTPRKRDIAMVFQSYALYPNMTVAGNISFGMEMRGVPAEERKQAIEKVAEDLADRPSARAQAEPALGWAAPARRNGTGAGARPQAVPVRRAALQPRCQAARRYADRDQAAASGDRDLDRLCHARSRSKR